MKRINYKSDFDFLLKLTDASGNELGWPSFDWSLNIYTRNNTSSVFTASCIDGEVRNCFNDNGAIHVVCDSHGLGTGLLYGEFYADIPNVIYSDGRQLTVTPFPLGITLVSSAGDEPTTAEVEAGVTAIYINLYELAVMAGYTGTEAEYMLAVTRLPDMVSGADAKIVELGEAVKAAYTAADEATLTAAKTYADSKDAATLTAAKTYADEAPDVRMQALVVAGVDEEIVVDGVTSTSHMAVPDSDEAYPDEGEAFAVMAEPTDYYKLKDGHPIQHPIFFRSAEGEWTLPPLRAGQLVRDAHNCLWVVTGRDGSTYSKPCVWANSITHHLHRRLDEAFKQRCFDAADLCAMYGDGTLLLLKAGTQVTGKNSVVYSARADKDTWVWAAGNRPYDIAFDDRPNALCVASSYSKSGQNADWHRNYQGILYAPDADGTAYAPTTCQNLFLGCASLTALDTSRWDLSGCSEFRSWFSGCGLTGTLDLSHTAPKADVTHYMADAFWNSKLSVIDFGEGRWAPSSLSLGFNSSPNLEAIHAAGWDFSGCTIDALRPWYLCPKLRWITVGPGWFTCPKVLDIGTDNNTPIGINPDGTSNGWLTHFLEQARAAYSQGLVPEGQTPQFHLPNNTKALPEFADVVAQLQALGVTIS